MKSEYFSLANKTNALRPKRFLVACGALAVILLAAGNRCFRDSAVAEDVPSKNAKEPAAAERSKAVDAKAMIEGLASRNNEPGFLRRHPDREPFFDGSSGI